MANKLLNWAMKQLDVLGPAKCVLIVLANRADKKTHQCYPSLTQIAQDSGFDRRTVARCLVELEAVNKIQRQRRGNDNTIYTLQLVSHSHYTQCQADTSVTPSLVSESPTIVSESHISDIIDKPKLTVDKNGNRFDEFWNQSTKRGSRIAAMKAWNQINPTEELGAKIFDGMVRWQASEQWQDERFQPHVSTWLRREGWEELVPARNNGSAQPAKVEAYGFLKEFDTAWCEICEVPHAWKVRESYADTTRRVMACPDWKAKLKK